MTFQPVYIVDGMRSPFLKAAGAPGPFSAADLAVQTGRALLLRNGELGRHLDEVIIGCAAPSPDEVNIGRVIALRLGLDERIPAWTVMRNCASGMQALDSAIANIQRGTSQLVLAGGVDALSHAPLLFSNAMVRWLAQWYKARSVGERARALSAFKPRYLAPVIGLLKGLTDPVVGLSMGQTAENLAHAFGIDRTAMDRFAVQSHQRAMAARDGGHFDHEIAALIDGSGKVYQHDDGIRDDSSVERLAKLKPVFDKPAGNVTAGNSSQVTDGAALLMLASEQAVNDYQLTPLGKITDSQWAGLSPAQMGLGPVHAATPILKRQQLSPNDLDAWEINEAFAAQVLACQAAWKDQHYCESALDYAAPGPIDPQRLNVDGGAIALGHPVGASGARIVLHLLNVLRHRQQQRGIAAICIGGGQGGAMLIENLSQGVAS
ncbi:Beta-ketoadipyl-CoA thiolase [Carnimonas sp. R-84981]|uniref:acetyl-CoA C-acetyltransferase n=1 Tax=Carnimonas bestiolae TaxID=3402172 RepID=UPI003EDCA5DC